MRKLALFALPAAALLCALLATTAGSAAQDADRKTAATKENLSATIDAEIAKVWKRDKISPAKRSGDEEFLRRVYLDTVGEPPTRQESVNFLDSKDEHKRAKLIDRLIDDPRFGQHMADQWTVLLTSRDANALSGSHLLAHWLAEEFNHNTGFDRIIREFVTAEGELVDNPAIIPYFAGGEAVRFTDMIAKLSKNLMGVQIQCAECHDHPFEKWTQDQYYETAAYFARVGLARNEPTAEADTAVFAGGC